MLTLEGGFGENESENSYIYIPQALVRALGGSMGMGLLKPDEEEKRKL